MIVKKTEETNSIVKREIAVCADDYGVDSSVNEAIVDLAAQGRLSATSVLVDGSAVDHASVNLSPLPLDIGLHLNFTEVIGQLNNNDVRPLGHLILRAHARLLNHQWVSGGIKRQLDRFESLFGRAPDYIDGHLHIHQLPVIREVLLEALEQRYRGLPLWIRDTRSPKAMRQPWSWSDRVKPWVIGHLGMARLAEQSLKRGWRTNQGLAGVYDFTREHPAYLEMLKFWCSHCPSGSLIMTHPAKRSLSGDPIGQSRVDEYQVLGSETFGQYLTEHAIQIRPLSQVLSTLP